MRKLELQIIDKTYQLPIEKNELIIEANFQGLSQQAILDISVLTLTNDAKDQVINLFEKVGPYEKIPAKLVVYEESDSYVFFDGYLDFNDESFSIINPDFGAKEFPSQVKCKFVSLQGRDELKDKLENVFSTLENEGVFNSSDYQDLDFSIEDDFNMIEIAFCFYVLFSVQDQIAVITEKISKTIAEIQAIATSDTFGAGLISSIIYAAIVLALQSIYFIILVALYANTIYNIITAIIPPVYTHKVTSLYTLLSKSSEWMGYKFVCPISELEKIYYLPSNPYDNSNNLIKNLLPFPALIKKGLPNPSEKGYSLRGMFDIVRKAFNANLGVVNNNGVYELHLRNVLDPFWKKQSKVTLPDINRPLKKINSSQLFGTNTLEFTVDQSDKWSIRNYTGTSYEVVTKVKNKLFPQLDDNIKGLKREILPVGLVSRKDNLNIAENIIKEIAELVDGLASLVGGKLGAANKIKSKIGVAKLSTSAHSVPRLVWIEGNRIPSNHRDLLSAKSLYENHHQSKSFVYNNFENQKSISPEIQNVKISLNEFKHVIGNQSVKLHSGKDAKVLSFKYNAWSSIVNYSYEEKHVYSNNIEEYYNEG